uniref:Putative secreted protein n=1 Tax=Anopheles triannulatus TaxID=58253 RepID=A0A2M4B3D0_9DIPT
MHYTARPIPFVLCSCVCALVFPFCETLLKPNRKQGTNPPNLIISQRPPHFSEKKRKSHPSLNADFIKYQFGNIVPALLLDRTSDVCCGMVRL